MCPCASRAARLCKLQKAVSDSKTSRQGLRKLKARGTASKQVSARREQQGSASGSAARPVRRAFVAANRAFQAACRGNLPVWYGCGSSSQKIFALQIFFGSPDWLTDCFDCGGVCLSRRPRAQRAGAEGGEAALGSSAADLYQDKHTPYCHLCFSGQNPGFFRVILAACLTVARMKKGENRKSALPL